MVTSRATQTKEMPRQYQPGATSAALPPDVRQGLALPFFYLRIRKALPYVGGIASLENALDGKAEPFRTSDGKAALYYAL